MFKSSFNRLLFQLYLLPHTFIYRHHLNFKTKPRHGTTQLYNQRAWYALLTATVREATGSVAEIKGFIWTLLLCFQSAAILWPSNVARFSSFHESLKANRCEQIWLEGLPCNWSIDAQRIFTAGTAGKTLVFKLLNRSNLPGATPVDLLVKVLDLDAVWTKFARDVLQSNSASLFPAVQPKAVGRYFQLMNFSLADRWFKSGQLLSVDGFQICLFWLDD